MGVHPEGPRRGEHELGGLAIEPVSQDRVDMAIGAGARGQGAGTGGVHPRRPVALVETEQAETRAIALLWVRATRQDRLDEGRGGGPDRRGPA